jgi:hypothetical protein
VRLSRGDYAYSNEVIVGRGQFGVVLRALPSNGRQFVALKRIEKNRAMQGHRVRRGSETRLLPDLCDEISIHSS